MRARGVRARGKGRRGVGRRAGGGGRRPFVRVALRLARHDLRRFLVGGFLWLPVSVIPLANGLLLKALFDRISGHRLAGLDEPLWLCAAFVATEAVRGAFLVTAWSYGVWWWDASATVLRANVLRSVLTAPGPATSRLPAATGEAIGRLRDDVGVLVDLVDEFVPLVGAVLFAAGALAVMASIDPLITLVLVLPMLAVGVLTPVASARVRRLHRRSQALGATVTGFVGEMFGAVLAVKTAGAEDAVLRRLAEHNRRRRDAAVRDRLATDVLGSATGASVEASIGLVLLLAAGSMRRGDFTVGDLALFTTYVSWLTALPRSLGAVLFRVPQAGVSVERLSRLLAAGEDEATLVRDTRVWFRTPAPDAPSVPVEQRPSEGPVEGPFERPDGDAGPLRRLEVHGLTVRRPGGRGLHGVDLDLERGTVTVVTGPVGAGKTTLVRALLGLERADAGSVRWNGRPVADPSTFLVPSRTAYAAQVPSLFSAPLRENLLLGWDGRHLDRAVRLAAFEDDVAAMPDGLDTVVGPRGARLSGGQVQRATAARALVRSPDLLVLDDLSSALDVETEHLLWQRLTAAARDGSGPATLLVVSHRRAALERADRILVLEEGRLVADGTLEGLLRTSPQLRRLWSDGSLAEALDT